ncbi:unnamed protein product [Merluccius merluccius]
MKICVNLMAALALSKEPLEDHSYRLSAEEEERTPTAIDDDSIPDQDGPRGFTLKGATRVHLNPGRVLPPIATSNSTLGRRPIHYDGPKTLSSSLFLILYQPSPEVHLPEVSLASLKVLLHRVTDRVGKKARRRRADVGVHWGGSGSGSFPETDQLPKDRALLQRLGGNRAEEEERRESAV